ncbi:site-specific integrase [Pseudomonas mosselii]|uniref:hypothetical protein n=1 Tax=Pseudomonas mosselii TaxID=78327 RepID=UPI0009DFA13D|nr:hypothetical protein [Pseudomonas mosselii]MCL8302728.1 hypothetical protein [Pseudomonas mosselii]MCL8341438.1 hypothetical protein [Pseudomonas mosselii]MCU9527855.1 hypothetical protein [Pseudomonas mosselii]MCU9536389.1 hypothetical protein [Pseudomonas mosselii]MCU9541884.1 hypothetical protein [Pseudomonas mosselii]
MSARIVCQFSCGAASAVATKLALAEYGSTHDVQIINAFLANEESDNRRFAQDCETWFGQPITVLRDEKYGADAHEVFRRERYMKGRTGTPCTKILKRRLLDSWKQPGDVMVFGYTAEEADRLEDFRERNPDRPVIVPLIDRSLGKDDCKAILLRAGIELPLMYRLLRRLGIRYRPPYNCRHTYATICLMSGLNPAFIAQQLGHSVQMLLSTYARWINSSSDWQELEKLQIGPKLVRSCEDST